MQSIRRPSRKKERVSAPFTELLAAGSLLTSIRLGLPDYLTLHMRIQANLCVNTWSTSCSLSSDERPVRSGDIIEAIQLLRRVVHPPVRRQLPLL